MSTARFFEVHDQRNIIKTKIVTDYFAAWSTFMLPRLTRHSDRLAFIDLFAGPGRFEDGQPSTPLWILESAVKNSTLCERLITVFNDKNVDFARQLRTEIQALPGIGNLAHRPRVTNITVGTDLVDLFRGLSLVPTLFFIDPWGYKGLSLDLIGTAIKSWGCDCIFFFNYNRINPGLNNPFVAERMNDLFGSTRADRLRAKVIGRSSDERQTLIIDELTEALGEVGGSYVLPFEFESELGERPSHYIIFVSKNFRGYHLMKEVMSRASTDDWEIKRFAYVPLRSPQMSLFPNLGRTVSIASLKEFLVRACAGKSLTPVKIYEANTVGTPYTQKNVKDAIIALEKEGRVTVDKPPEKRMRKGEVTLGDQRTVTFPSLERTST